MKAALQTYINMLSDHDALSFRSIPYGYAEFSDGIRITPQMRRAYAAAVYPVLEDTHGFIDMEEATPFYGVSISPNDRFSFQKDVYNNPFCTTDDCTFGSPQMKYIEWFLAHSFHKGVNMEGDFFYSSIEDDIWNLRPDLQAVFPDPIGKDFSDFKSWVDERIVLENGVDAGLFHKWQSVWDHHQNHHFKFHKSVESKDVGVNIIGWHGGQFSIGITAAKLLNAAKSAKVSANAIQMPGGESNKFIHPRHLNYKVTRSPNEMVNLIIMNADSTPQLSSHIPSVILKSKYNIGYWAWELDVFPSNWMTFLKEYDEIWALKKFCNIVDFINLTPL